MAGQKGKTSALSQVKWLDKYGI